MGFIAEYDHTSTIKVIDVDDIVIATPCACGVIEMIFDGGELTVVRYMVAPGYPSYLLFSVLFD